MSPEQTRSTDADHRSDVWSLGVVLYEMLTGRRPFRADDHRGLLEAIRETASEPIRRLRADVPASLAAIVERCLAKEPEARPSGAAALAAELEAFLRSAARGTRLPRKWRRHVLVTSAAAVAVLAIAAAMAKLRGGRETAPATASIVAVLPFVPAMPDTALGRLGRELVVTLSSSVAGRGFRSIRCRRCVRVPSDPTWASPQRASRKRPGWMDCSRASVATWARFVDNAKRSRRAPYPTPSRSRVPLPVSSVRWPAGQPRRHACSPVSSGRTHPLPGIRALVPHTRSSSR